MATKEGYARNEAGQVLYANADAVTVGEIINIAGIGAAVAANTYGAGIQGVYNTDGVYQLPIGTGVTVAAGNRCYWDKSANKIILTGMALEDFEIGRAVAAGTAEAGYVDVRIGANAADYRTSGGLTAAKIAIAVGSRTVVGTELLETLTDARFQTTDTVLTSVEASFPTSWRITGVTKGTGSHVITFQTLMTGGVVAYSVLK
jgi:predicted RecA/RadA family phage recombinase